MRRFRFAFLVVAGALAASTGSCSCSEKASASVTVELEDGWNQFGAERPALERSAAKARRSGHSEVADTLLFDADAVQLGDVSTVVLTEDAGAAVTVRRHDGRAESLGVAVERMRREIEEQQVAVEVSQVTFHGAAAWQFRYTGAPRGLRYDVYWFETRSERFSVEIVGRDSDVAALADAVRIER